MITLHFCRQKIKEVKNKMRKIKFPSIFQKNTDEGIYAQTTL